MENHFANKSTQGVALVTVLVITVVAIVLLAIMNSSIVNDLQTGRAGKVRNQMTQAADGLSEQARLTLATEYKNGLQRPSIFATNKLNHTSNTTDLGNGISGRWQVKRIAASNSEYSWLEVYATAWRGSENQTVVRRIGIGNNPVFQLAMLSEQTDCMYCHLHVNGDVGSLKDLRPGWGFEGGGGAGSGGGSTINGTVYASKGVSADDSTLVGNNKTINGTAVTGDIKTGWNEQPLSNLAPDRDGDGLSDFPPIRRSRATAIANGAISGGQIIKVPKGGTLALADLGGGVGQSLNKTYSGNVVLIGTPSNPIVLNNDIYVDGDVVIKGVVTGRGAIYTGRNLYIAGNLTVQNAPDQPGSGVCASVTDPGDCADANIAAGKDEVRLAARGSTVIGDYTERDSANNLLPYEQLQSADYYRAQFNFNGGSRYYDAQTGDELMGRSDGSFINVEGEVIGGTRVLVRTADRTSTNDAYSYSFRPGSIASDGSFSNWISDDLYKNGVLGSANQTQMSWRSDLGRRYGESDPDYVARLKNELIASRIPASAAQGVACAAAGVSGTANGCPDNPSTSGDLLDEDGSTWGYFSLYGDSNYSTLRVVVDKDQPYETQVTQVDAFLYSNSRIAGKTSSNALAINGGLIAKDIGVLAPGRKLEWWMAASRYSALNDPNTACGAGADPRYRVPLVQECKFTINYDHRMRKASGYGFNLVQGQAGTTIAWRLSDQASERVNP